MMLQSFMRERMDILFGHRHLTCLVRPSRILVIFKNLPTKDNKIHKNYEQHTHMYLVIK